ncbi:hypothetical protein AMK26_10500 [Streptomyces sp. CB03234]|uniref:hypothetical protein n=1 Tax=Streptomyces sp. (strain CB03234) TaxID=1703937 RepID=UPI000939225D|nr:hypothetical protein [Streptomyces sp. CB03234]OKK06439.1 hypothetical protein AMK26_10500 [Streptomyces sp. CB03234]
MKTKTLHWTDSLTDSVYALWETATEYRTAYLHAYLARHNAEFDRRRIHDGVIGICRRLNDRGDTRHHRRAPHFHALSLISDAYRRAERELQQRYEDAALLYASGAAWAIASVQRSETPPVVEFTEADGQLAHHGLEISGLDRYAGAHALRVAYQDLAVKLGAAGYAEDLAAREYLADHEAGELHAALDDAAGIADAAYAYGQLAHKALHFVLLEPIRDRERQLALARALRAASDN